MNIIYTSMANVQYNSNVMTQPLLQTQTLYIYYIYGRLPVDPFNLA